MPYEFLEDIATADVAFEAWGDTIEEMIVAAADATMNVMVGDLRSISENEHRLLCVENDDLDMLLFDLLQEIIFYKDAERLLLRLSSVQLDRGDGCLNLAAKAYGEEINPSKHDLIVDVKAVTLHRYRVEQTSRGWSSTVILDI